MPWAGTASSSIKGEAPRDGVHLAASHRALWKQLSPPPGLRRTPTCQAAVPCTCSCPATDPEIPATFPESEDDPESQRLAAPLGPPAAMPVAEKAQGGRATVQRRPFCPPRPGGGGAENEPPHPSAADAPQGADPGPSPGPAPPSEPNGSPAAGPPRPLLPSGGAARSGTLQVVLCNYSLWLAFHGQQNEMMLKRPGRAMFPFLAYQIRGLEPRARYRVFVDMVRVDGQHWRYEKARWAPYEPEESHVPDNQVYPHPDSPNTGAHWMQRDVAFKTLRLTNAQPAARSAGRAIWLQSQHRYRPRLHVQELGGGDREAPAAASRPHVFSFPETEFIAVTAYRNAEIIRLKIAHNPYAKAFRRRSAAAGSSSAGPPPPPAAALPPSLLPPTSAAAAPHPDRREPPGCGAREQPRLHRKMCSRGTQTDAQDAAGEERAPKKRRLSPGPSGSRAVSSARAHGQAQAQPLPAPEGSMNASPEAAAEDPGDLPVTEEAAVQEGDRAMPANCWALQQPQQPQQPLYYVFDSTPSSSSSSSSSNDQATLEVVTLDLQTSPTPLEAIYGSNPENWLALLQAAIFPADPSQGTSGDCDPSLPLQPVPGAQEQLSVQEQIWPHLTQTELEDSAQAEGAPQKRGLSPQASGSQARCSEGADEEARDQLLTAAASSPYTFPEATSQDPGQASVPDSRKGIPVLSSAPQQSQPPLHPPLLKATPAAATKAGSSNSSGLETLQVETLNPGLQTSPTPLEAE
ncbi:T-box transcription factor TBX21-like [Sarcophilus harrisii]|uniref:T-box transcription factor TBX21-like n=1 Tax=Sarcophilus harrisii TaxID=9305 RepID=UPI001301ED84|nr:T-box transcription factor TBX21-like [Sarcophilus harrisii]